MLDPLHHCCILHAAEVPDDFYQTERNRLLRDLPRRRSSTHVVTSHAQVSAASINGAARDATGAVVPAATVLLRNTETGVETRTMTNEQGVYVIQSILPGTYTLEASKEGFTTSRQGPVTLVVNQRSIFDFE